MPAESAQETVACSLSPQQLAERRQELIPGLFARAEKTEDLPDGIRFRFANKPGLLPDLAKLMESEQACCSFLRFELRTEAGGGPITFDVLGPQGTAEMLRKL